MARCMCMIGLLDPQCPIHNQSYPLPRFRSASVNPLAPHVPVRTYRLSTTRGDHHYLWRSSLAPHQVIQFGRWPGHDYWVEYKGDGIWRRAGRTGCIARPATDERVAEVFIRVAQVLR